MKTEVSFYNQVFEWLHATGLDYSFQKEEAIFDKIAVSRNSLKLMDINLIEIISFQSPDAVSNYQRYIDHERQIRDKGVLSVSLWEDLWKNKSEIVKSRLLALLGSSVRIPGRLTYVARIHKEVCEDFLNKNHLQGSVSSKYRYGLFLPVRYFRVLPKGFLDSAEQEDLLVGVATFSNAKIFSKNEKPFRSHEMIRFANHLNTTVVGGLNKLLSAFTKEFQPDDIMTYVDLEWSNGLGYSKLGFEMISNKPPIHFWIDANSKERYTERNIPGHHDLILIANAGSTKFVKTIIKEIPLY